MAPTMMTTSEPTRFAATWTMSRLVMIVQVGAGLTRSRCSTPTSRSRARVRL